MFGTKTTHSMIKYYLCLGKQLHQVKCLFYMLKNSKLHQVDIHTKYGESEDDGLELCPSNVNTPRCVSNKQ